MRDIAMHLSALLRRRSTRLAAFCQQQRGQAIVMVSLSMVFIVGFLALTLDAGYAYAQRRKMQNAADAAAQAAARLIALDSACYGTGCPPYTDTNIRDTITYYVGQNQGSVDYVNAPPLYVNANGQILSTVGTGTVPAAAAGTVITATSTFPSFFAAVFGRNTLAVQTRSSALMGVSLMPTSSIPRDLVPLSVPLQDYLSNPAALYDLWGPQYGQGYNLPAEYKGLLDLNAGSGPSYVPGAPCTPINTCLAQWSEFGFDGRLGNDNIIPIVPGDRTSQVDDALRAYCESQNRMDAGGVYGLFKLAIFNSYDPSSGNVHISGFAQFKVYCDTIGNHMSGRFVSYISPGGQIVAAGDTTVPGPRTVAFVDPFTGLPGGPAPTPTATPNGGAPTWTPVPPTATATHTSTPTSTPTRTPTATAVAATQTPTPPGPTATPTSTSTVGPTATPTPRSYTVVWWSDAQYSTVSRGATNFTCAAGNITAGPIHWTSQAATDLYFIVWPADQPAPTRYQVTYHVDSGQSFTQFLASAGLYTIYTYDDGTNSNKNATISAFTVTCR